MKRLIGLYEKEEKLVIGLMSGTSVDGIDAALVKIKGNGIQTKVELIDFINYGYEKHLREAIFELFEEKTSSNLKICEMNFVLGEYFAKAAIGLCEKNRISLDSVDLIGSHGQTIYHQPNSQIVCGYPVKSTLQIGEGAVIAERTNIITISDFRVRDMAAGGDGAPLVPYTEYLLYRSDTECIGLQNIGGIGNLTVLPANCKMKDVRAFDTGPGNMVMDGVISNLTQGELQYDANGTIAAKGKVNDVLLNELLKNEYFKKVPPKTTGREEFGATYVKYFLKQCSSYKMTVEDMMATATALTAKSIAMAAISFSQQALHKLIVGGGGSYNKTLLKFMEQYLKIPVLTQEDLGLNSDAKEAIAFAILANETIMGNTNNLPYVTGAKRPVILGKINL